MGLIGNIKGPKGDTIAIDSYSTIQLKNFTSANTAIFDGSLWLKKSGNKSSNGGTGTGTIINIDSSNYWERITDGAYYKFEYFGAKKQDGSNFDNLPAFINLINFLNNSPQYAYITIIFSDEYYFSNSVSVPVLTRSFVTFKGLNKNSCKLSLGTGTYFKIGNGSNFVESFFLTDLNITSRTPDTSNPVILYENSFRMKLDNIQVYNCGTFAQIGTNDNQSGDIRISRLLGVNANAGKPFFQCVKGTGFFMADMTCNFYHMEATAPRLVKPVEGDSTTVMNTVAGTNVIDVVGSWDTMNLKFLAEKMYRVVNIQPATSSAIFEINIHDCIFDYIRDNAIDINIPSGSSMAMVNIHHNYVNSYEGHSIKIYSIGRSLNVALNNNNILFSGKAGIYCDGFSYLFKRLNINGNMIENSCRTETFWSNIVLGDGISGFTINDNLLDKADSFSGIDWVGAVSSITVNGINHDDFIIEGNKTYDITYTYPTTSNLANNSKNRRIINNITSTQTRGNLTGNAAYTTPTTNTIWYNNSPFDIEIFIGGGTITAIYKNETLLPFVSGQLRLSAGDSYRINYTGSPSVIYNILS